MKVVISIGGSVLMPELGADQVAQYARIIELLRDDGIQVGVVVGGGKVAREYIETARSIGANEIQLDQLGIDVTRINARLLLTALGDDAVVAPPTSYEQAGEAFRNGNICVMGGVAPAQTTDAVSAAFAEYVNADLLVFATSVSGVYSDDPNKDETATKYETLNPAELVDIVSGLEINAGSPAPVDALAAKIIQRSNMRSIVIDGSNPDNISRAILTGDHSGTDVIPDGIDSKLPPWDSDDN